MPEKRFSAAEEITLRIKALDADESEWRRKAAKAEIERDVALSEVIKIGSVRRQYEAALSAIQPEMVHAI